MNPKYAHIGDPETKLIEECSELIQVVCKAKRFGWLNFHLDHPEKNNIRLAKEEMLDLIMAWKQLEPRLEQLEKIKSCENLYDDTASHKTKS